MKKWEQLKEFVTAFEWVRVGEKEGVLIEGVVGCQVKWGMKVCLLVGGCELVGGGVDGLVGK